MIAVFVIGGLCVTFAVGVLCERFSPLAVFFVMAAIGAALKAF